MKHFISMSSTLSAFLDDDSSQILLEDLLGGTFYFGCAPGHLAGVPHEATWSNVDRPRVYAPEDLLDSQSSTVSIEQVDARLRDKVRQFLALVEAADDIGRVHWQVGNYHALLKKLAEEASPGSVKLDDVWAFGRWPTLNAERKFFSNY